MFTAPERYRKIHPTLGNSEGNYGYFAVPYAHPYKKVVLHCIASDGPEWEHVSVSVHINGQCSRTPSWEEMSFIKNNFWGEEDCVIQYHPAKKDYINNHPYCLHLWRPILEEINTPDNILI